MLRKRHDESGRSRFDASPTSGRPTATSLAARRRLLARCPRRAFKLQIVGLAVAAGWFALASAPASAQLATGDLDVVFSTQRGYHDAPVSVELSTPSAPGATIRYSLGSTLPTAATGTVYTGPITISSTTVVSAIAVSGATVGHPTSHTYIFPGDVAAASNMSSAITGHPTWGPQLESSIESLPFVSLTFDRTMSTTEIPVSFEYHDPSGASTHELAGAREFGVASLNLPNTSIRVYFRKEYGAGRLDAPLFSGFAFGVNPAERFDKLDLRAGHDTFPGMKTNATYLATRFVDAQMTLGGRINSHTRPVFAYLNGEFWGLFTLRESFDDNFLAQYFGNDMVYEYGSFENNTAPIGYTTVEGDGSQVAALEAAARTSYDQFKDIIGDPNALYDWMIVDSYTLFEGEWNVAGNTTRGFSFNVNDMDRALWSTSAQYSSQPKALLTYLLNLKDDRVRRDFGDRVQCHAYGGTIDPANIEGLYRQMIEDIRLPIVAEAARRGDGTNTPATWKAIVADRLAKLANVRDWVLVASRAKDIYPELEPAQVSVDEAGLVRLTHSNPAGQLYYTVDGTDPVADDGSVSSTALTYSGPFAMPDGAGSVLARVHDPAQTSSWDRWSAACPTWVASDPGRVGLTINEIHYNPKTSSPDAGTAEFIELANLGTTIVDLGEVRIEGGISYYLFGTEDRLGPGEYLVLTDEPAVFAATYGFEADGIFHRSLGNGGETLEVVGPGLVYDRVTYSDAGDWPATADGFGPSLELRPGHDAASNDPGSAWQVSSSAGGTPGAANSGGLIVGDADCDGALSADDAISVLEYLVGARSLNDDCDGPAGTAISALHADVEVDTALVAQTIDLVDAQMIARCVSSGQSRCSP